MEELRSLRGQPSADHHDQTKLYDGSGASDRSDPPDPADRKQRKKFSQCLLSVCDLSLIHILKSGLRETMAGKVTFLFLLFLYTGVMLYLFWMECYQVPGFQSDMPDYVNKVAGIAGNYEFPYPILFWTARLSALSLIHI